MGQGSDQAHAGLHLLVAGDLQLLERARRVRIVAPEPLEHGCGDAALVLLALAALGGEGGTEGQAIHDFAVDCGGAE
eukprot:5792908-Alexandrium_andersonii.AAC.1